MKTGLTIQEAIKSGKPFKRPKDYAYIQFLHVGGEIILDSLEDLMATDWEIKREPKTLWVIYYEYKVGDAFNTEEQAQEYLKFWCKPGEAIRIVKMVEVTE